MFSTLTCHGRTHRMFVLSPWSQVTQYVFRMVVSCKSGLAVVVRDQRANFACSICVAWLIDWLNNFSKICFLYIILTHLIYFFHKNVRLTAWCLFWGCHVLKIKFILMMFTYCIGRNFLCDIIFTNSMNEFICTKIKTHQHKCNLIKLLYDLRL